MNLPSPITLTVNYNHIPKEITFTELPVRIIDDSRLKKVWAFMPPFMRLLTLWEKESYDAVGDYTQAQAEARILELLGDDPKSVLETLII
jgi:hypothetical protein